MKDDDEQIHFYAGLPSYVALLFLAYCQVLFHTWRNIIK